MTTFRFVKNILREIFYERHFKTFKINVLKCYSAKEETKNGWTVWLNNINSHIIIYRNIS